MKKKISFTSLLTVMTLGLYAQETTTNWWAASDIVSSYVWRGLYLSDASIQPTVSFSSKGFSIGGWGSAGSDGYLEADLFAKYHFDFGLLLGLTDYYFPSIENGNNYFDVSEETGSHTFEINLGYEIAGFNITGNYILNKAGGAGSQGSDMYFEADYSYKNFRIFVGGGNGWHSHSGNFNITNIGIGIIRDIPISATLSFPVKGSIVLNPNTQKCYVVAGVTL
jgi:hypothetical protein